MSIFYCETIVTGIQESTTTLTKSDSPVQYLYVIYKDEILNG